MPIHDSLSVFFWGRGKMEIMDTLCIFIPLRMQYSGIAIVWNKARKKSVLRFILYGREQNFGSQKLRTRQV